VIALKNIKYLTLAIIMSILLSACMNKNEYKNKNVEKKEKAPETLVEVSRKLDTLLASMDSIEEIIELTESEFQAKYGEKESKKKEEQGSKQSNGGNQQQNQEQGQQNQNQQNQNQQSQGQEEQKQTIRTKNVELFLKWQEVDKNLEEIHKSWNNYEVESRDKGATDEKADKFKSDLNALTVAVESREIDSIIDAGSRAFNSLATFFDLYKDEIGGDLARVKYSAYQAFLLVQKGNKEEAKKLLDETQDHISRVRKGLKEDKTKDLEKLSLSISDMKKALDSGSMELLKIKRDIAVENIKNLQE